MSKWDKQRQDADALMRNPAHLGYADGTTPADDGVKIAAAKEYLRDEVVGGHARSLAWAGLSTLACIATGGAALPIIAGSVVHLGKGQQAAADLRDGINPDEWEWDKNGNIRRR